MIPRGSNSPSFATSAGNSEDATTQAAAAAGHAAKLASADSAFSKYHNVDTFTLIFDLRDFGLANMNYDAISTLVNLCTYQVSTVFAR